MRKPLLFVWVGFVVLSTTIGCSKLVDEIKEILDGGGHGNPKHDAGHGGVGGSNDAGCPPDGGGGGADAGSDGGLAEIGACAELAFSSAMRLAPAAAGQQYVRCETHGPETGWRVTLSHDARFLAARTAAGTVRLLGTAPWAEVAQLASPLGIIDAVAFSPDGASLATLSTEMGVVALWRTQDGAFVRSFAGPPGSTIDAHTSALAFSRDGARLATSLGTLIDIASGIATNWTTGAPSNVMLVVNPQNLDTGRAIPRILFAAGEERLFVHTAFQIGNSPTSARLSLVTPTTGEEQVLFEMYDRALTGFAVSADRRLVALAKTDEARVGGFASGLAIFRADTGAQVATDETFTGDVLAFSPDGARLHTRSGDTIMTLDVAGLGVVGTFTWPAGTTFLGVSPAGDLVGAVGGTTGFWDPGTGAEIRSFPGEMTAVSWSADGFFGAGTGDPGTLFRFWREYDGVSLCMPPPFGPPAPPLASLGVTLDPSGTALSPDGSTVATDESVLHTHASDWTAVRVRDVPSSALLRVFGATPMRRDIALSAPSADRLFTQQGSGVAVWCR